MVREDIRNEILSVLRETQKTKIIYYGYVFDDKDKDVLGRVRVIPLTKPGVSFSQEDANKTRDDLKENAWTPKDEYLFNPLLPLEINPVPKETELVLIIYGDTLYPDANRYYVKVSPSSASAIAGDHYMVSMANTAQGIRNEAQLSPKNDEGEYRNEKVKGVFAEPGDNALLGRGSADVIVKPDEVLIRAGKTQEFNVDKLPQGYQNRAFLQLSNFKQTKINKDPETKIQIDEIVLRVKKVVLWEILNLDNTFNTFNGSIKLYRINEREPSDLVNTKNFKLDTILKLSIGTHLIGPDAGVSFLSKTKEEILQIFNEFIQGVLYSSINLPVSGVTLTGNFPFAVTDQFPLVISPSYGTYFSGFSLNESVTTNDVAELKNFSEFFAGVKVNQNKFESGWILVPNPPKNGKVSTGPVTDVKIQTVTPSDFAQSPITYGVLGAQKVYLLSQSVQGAPNGDINLKDTLYGIPQPKFIGDEKSLEKQTYPTVRGDQLMILLRKIFEFIKGHVHPVATMQPIPVSAGNGQTTREIDEILADAENKILNQHIRIN